MTRVFRWVWAVVGIALLGMNLAGLFLPLRSPEIGHLPLNRYGNTLTLSRQEVERRLRPDGRSHARYAADVTRTVHQALTYYWGSQDPRDDDRYRLRIPLHENYLLFLANVVRPDIFRRYEIADYRKALERGVGTCSQSAVIATMILRERGIEARTVLLLRHTVTTARVGEAGEWWVIDPTCGAIVKRPIDAILADPEIIRGPYREAGQSDEAINTIIAAFRSSRSAGKSVIAVPERLALERGCDVAKWALPATMLLATGVLGRRRGPRVPSSPAGEDRCEPE